jgi:hypothetical protein
MPAAASVPREQPRRSRAGSRVDSRHTPRYAGAGLIGDHMPPLLALHSAVGSLPPARVHRLEQMKPQQIVGGALR